MFEEMKNRHLFGITILFLILSGFLGTLFSASEDFSGIAIQFALYIAAPIVYFRYQFKKLGVSLNDVVFIKGTKEWIPSVLLFVAISVLFSLSISWLQFITLNSFAPSLVDLFFEPFNLPENPVLLALSILFICIIGPIAEEFAFRGLLLKRMISKTSVWGGIFISSFLFGILHMDIIGSTIFGIIAALLYLITNNLAIPILFHITNNSFAMVLTYINPTWPDWLLLTTKADLYTHIPFKVGALVISATLIWIVIRRLRNGLRNSTVEELDF